MAEDQMTLRMSREVAADRDRVWRAWTTEIERWLWPTSFATVVELEPVPGTEFRIASAPAELTITGQVVEVDPPHRLVLTWQWEGEESVTQVTIGLHEREGGTEVLLVHEGHESSQQLEDHRAGWESCLPRLEEYLG